MIQPIKKDLTFVESEKCRSFNKEGSTDCVSVRKIKYSGGECVVKLPEELDVITRK